MCDVTLLSGCGQFLLPAYRGFFQCFLKVILIGSFKNLMFVILQRRSGLVLKKKKNQAILYLKFKFSVHPLLGLDQMRKLVF